MSNRPALAVSLYVAGRRAVVVGEGPMAEERRERLAHAGADVLTVAPAAYAAARLAGAFVVFCLDRALGPAIAADARAAGALVYVLDEPGLSDFAMPALARRGPLSLAIATDGEAPALARRLREELERLLATDGPALDALLGELVDRRAVLPSGERRDVLYAIARRLRLTGRFTVDPAPADDPAAG